MLGNHDLSCPRNFTAESRLGSGQCPWSPLTDGLVALVYTECRAPTSLQCPHPPENWTCLSVPPHTVSNQAHMCCLCFPAMGNRGYGTHQTQSPESRSGLPQPSPLRPYPGASAILPNPWLCTEESPLPLLRREERARLSLVPTLWLEHNSNSFLRWPRRDGGALADSRQPTPVSDDKTKPASSD